MSPTVASHCIDDGKTRVVATIESTRAVLHVTKYGEKSTVCVTASMHEADAHQLGLWLLEHARQRKVTQK